MVYSKKKKILIEIERRCYRYLKGFYGWEKLRKDLSSMFGKEKRKGDSSWDDVVWGDIYAFGYIGFRFYGVVFSKRDIVY